jgi:hypothetical protein
VVTALGRSRVAFSLFGYLSGGRDGDVVTRRSYRRGS